MLLAARHDVDRARPSSHPWTACKQLLMGVFCVVVDYGFIWWFCPFNSHHWWKSWEHALHHFMHCQHLPPDGIIYFFNAIIFSCQWVSAVTHLALKRIRWHQNIFFSYLWFLLARGLRYSIIINIRIVRYGCFHVMCYVVDGLGQDFQILLLECRNIPTFSMIPEKNNVAFLRQITESFRLCM